MTYAAAANSVLVVGKVGPLQLDPCGGATLEESRLLWSRIKTSFIVWSIKKVKQRVSGSKTIPFLGLIH